MQIVTECLFQWDIKNQVSKGKGIVGEVLGIGAADEEQGQKILHCHWLIWVKELNQNLRDCMFHPDQAKRDYARQQFCEHIDCVMSASYGSDIKVKHICSGNDGTEVNADKIYEDQVP